jgi:hypothetical protein
MLFKNPVRTSKRTPHFTITKINWLTLFKEIIAVYSENHAKPINTKCSITDCRIRWFIYLPLNLRGIICWSMKMLITNGACAPSPLISDIVLQSKGMLACSLDRNIRMCHVSIKLRHMTKKLCRYGPPTDLGRCMLATPQHLNQVKSLTWKARGGRKNNDQLHSERVHCSPQDGRSIVLRSAVGSKSRNLLYHHSLILIHQSGY